MATTKEVLISGGGFGVLASARATQNARLASSVYDSSLYAMSELIHLK
jgi:hypothetical protein